MKTIRKFATPLTMGAFLLSAVTGVLMFFHLDTGLNKAAHEWLSWAMVVGVALHIGVNYRAFTLYLKRPLAVGIVGVFAAFLAASFLPLGGTGGSPMAAIMQGLGQAPVERVIALTGEDTGAGLARLGAIGVAAEPGQTVAALAGGDRAQQAAILKAIFESQ